MLDCYSRHAWGRLYTSAAGDPVHVLNETVLPFFEAHEARVYTILSDNGREFWDALTITPTSCSCNWRIEHRPPWYAEQRLYRWLHRTLLDEHFRIKGTTWYESVEQMQTDLDSYLDHYNTQRPKASGQDDGRTDSLYSMFKRV